MPMSKKVSSYKWIAETSQGEYKGKTPNDAIKRVPRNAKIRKIRRIHKTGELLLYCLSSD